MGLHSVDIQAAGAGGAGGDHRVVEDRLKDGLLAIDVQAVPLLSELPAGANQLVDRDGVGGRGNVAAGLGNPCDDVARGNLLPRRDRALGKQLG